MKWSFASVGLVAAGLIGVVIILLFQNITVNNEEDYYLLKEISQAAMIDAIDLAHFREYGKLKIIQEKYVENFTRRFADSVNVTNASNYLLGFYNIMEYPPKASVNISTNIGEYTVFGNSLGAAGTQEYSVGNSLDSIIEIDELDEKIEDCDVKKTYYSIPYKNANIGVRDYVGIYASKVKEPEETGEWVATKIVPIGKIQMASHVKIYLETFGDMYYEEISPTAIIDPKMANYIAPANKIEIEKLEVNKEGSNTIVKWDGHVTCTRGSADLKTYGGVDLGRPVCIYGIIYELVWHNQECDA